MTSLNPVFTVGHQIGEVLRTHVGVSRQAARRSLDRTPQARRDPVRRAPGQRLPAPTLRRDAPARDDRDGGRLRSQGPDRRRADHGPRRHDPGRHPRRTAWTPRTTRHQHRPDHPRPRRGRGPRRPGGCHVRRTRRRDSRGARPVRESAAPVHNRPPRRITGRRPPCRDASPQRDPRPGARARGAARRLHLRRPLPAGTRHLYDVPARTDRWSAPGRVLESESENQWRSDGDAQPSPWKSKIWSCTSGRFGRSTV